MKEFFSEIGKDKTARFGFISAFVLSIITVIFILFTYGNLPPFIPIFNQLPWGEQRLGAQFTIFIPILATWIIIISNLFISRLMYNKTPLISRILAVTSSLVTILIFLFVVKTVTSIT